MKPLTIDFETYYSRDYSLRVMTTEEYIRGDEFEAIMLGYKFGDEPTQVVYRDDIPAFLDGVDWANTALVAYNTAFDAAILNWRYGHRPALYVDTMSMARPVLYPFTGSVALKKVVEALGLGEKGTEVEDALNMNYDDFSPDALLRYAGYCSNDVEITYNVYKMLVRLTPPDELRLIHEIIRMYVEPVLAVDRELLDDALVELIAEKDRVLDTALAYGAGRDVLMSNLRFANWLEQNGVLPPTKPSPSNPLKTTYAFAKTDAGMAELCNHHDPVVATVAKARVHAKSTIDQTRMQRILDLTKETGIMSVPMGYYRAHTGRPGGTEKVNMLNLPRGSALRNAIMAPEGHSLIVADQAQIEARMTAVLAGQDDLVKDFRDGIDVYTAFAARLYNVPFQDVTKEQRFVGKVAILSLGYGAGWITYQKMLSNYGHIATDDVCRETVAKYRSINNSIVTLWKVADHWINHGLYQGNDIEAGPISIKKGRIILPNGMTLTYPKLHRQTDGWVYYYGREERRMYGPKLVENLVQALAWIVVSRQLIEIARHHRVAHTVYDEIVCVVPDAEVTKACKTIEDIMTRPPPWMPNIPLKVDIAVCKRYGDAK